MAEGEFEISMVLTGPPRVNNRFASYEARMAAEYYAMVAEIADWYSGEIRQRFAESHGQSGDTADTIHPELVEQSRDRFLMAVRVAGHVGFVVNPLPSHIEMAVNKQALYDFAPAGAARGRTHNFYQPFGPGNQVTWHQGGDESHSPDTEWYTGENSALYAQASRDLHKLATFVQLAWNEAGSGTAVYTRATARMQYTYLRNR